MDTRKTDTRKPLEPTYSVEPPPWRMLVTRDCLAALGSTIGPEIKKRHEGIAYFVGATYDSTTLAVSLLRPEAITTRGSFMVPQLAMAKVVRVASDLGLHVVGQIHTHPREAFHSPGDDDGAGIRYTGFVSLVLPDYGTRLPKLDGLAAYVFIAGRGFVPLPTITILGGTVG